VRAIPNLSGPLDHAGKTRLSRPRRR
jgi:hypothetical protein